MERTIEELLQTVPAWKGQQPAATPLSGGITNQNYRVDAGGESFVLRKLSPSTEHLGIDREHEAACTRNAAELGIGPELVHFAPQDGVLVVRFVEGETLSPESARKPELVARIASAMRSCHEGPVVPGSFCPFETVRSYHALGTERGVRFPPSTPTALALADRMEKALHGVRTSHPCHNDLLAANFLDDGQKLWIIDWEYGGMGDPFFDLGNFSVNQELDELGRAHLLKCYLGRANDSRAAAHLRVMELASDLREAFWGFLQSGVSELDFDYLAYGGKHLVRFLEAASTDELETWLDAAQAR